MFKLVKANIRKDRNILIIFTLIIILSTFMLSVSMMAMKYRALFEDYAKETKTADFVTYNAFEQILKVCHKKILGEFL